MSTKLKIILAVVLVIIVAGGYMTYVQIQSKKNVKPIIKTATVKKGTVTRAVTATGTLQPLTTVSVKSNVGGQVMRLNVVEGMKVKMGDVIALIDPSDSQSAYNQAAADMDSANAKIRQAQLQANAQPVLTNANQEQARHSLDSAQAALDQLNNANIPQRQVAAKQALDQAIATLNVAQKESDRQHELLNSGYTPEKTVQAADAQLIQAQGQVDSARKKYDTLNSEIEGDREAAQARVLQAQDALNQAIANGYQNQTSSDNVVTARAAATRSKAALDNAKTNLDYCTVIAPRDGVVIKKYVEEGGMVAAGKSSGGSSGPGISIVDIADISHMYATVNVDETDIGKIKMGQPVEISVDAYSSDSFLGQVTKIAPQTVVTQNVTTIPVTVQVDSVDNRLLTGMNATCNFIIEQKKGVLAVPNEAVKSDSAGSYVQVLVNDVPTRRPVEIGLAGDAKTEIISGIAVDDKVITSITDPSKVKPGAAAGASSSRTGLNGGMPGGGGPPPR
ncbi:MAG: efflux RND transporter periplasmic adaptor subunit [bacterium]